MTPQVQTVVALLVVAVAAAWLIVRAVSKRRSSSCGSGECGALSGDVKKLQAHLKRQRRR